MTRSGGMFQRAMIAANMKSFSTDHIINPFERFAEYLSLAAVAPERFHLIELLTGLLFMACVWKFGFGWKGFGAMLLTGSLK